MCLLVCIAYFCSDHAVKLYSLGFINMSIFLVLYITYVVQLKKAVICYAVIIAGYVLLWVLFDDKLITKFYYLFLFISLFAIAWSVKNKEIYAAKPKVLSIGAIVFVIFFMNETFWYFGHSIGDVLGKAKVTYSFPNKLETENMKNQKLVSKMQSFIPEGEKVLLTINHIMFMDFSRNKLYHYYSPGYASPYPHIPIGKNPKYIKKYILDQNIRYVAYNQKQSHYELMKKDEGDFINSEANKNHENYIDALNRIAGTHKVLFKENGLTLIDLGTPNEKKY